MILQKKISLTKKKISHKKNSEHSDFQLFWHKKRYITIKKKKITFNFFKKEIAISKNPKSELI